MSPDEKIAVFPFQSDGIDDTGIVYYIVPVSKSLYFQMAFLRAISLMAIPENWYAPDADLADLAASQAAIAYNGATVLNFPKSVTIPHFSSVVIAGNPIAAVVSNLQPFNAFWRQTPASSEDVFEMYALLSAGDYTMRAVYVAANNQAIQQWFVNGVSIGTIDAYSSSVIYNSYSELNFTLDNPGLVTLRCEVIGKNVSSSDWRVSLSALALFQ